MIGTIDNGTVIDHIEPCKSIKIFHLLKLEDHPKTVSLGTRLKSNSMGLKDILKVEGRFFSARELESISLFAPRATISLIKEGKVSGKFKLELPKVIEGGFECLKAQCISHTEQGISSFKIHNQNKMIELECEFCQGRFKLHDLSLAKIFSK